MRIKENYMIRSVAGQNIVVPIGDAAIDFNAMISLNDTGTFLWNKMTEETTESALINSLLEEYDVSEAVAAADVSAFVNKLREAKLINE